MGKRAGRTVRARKEGSASRVGKKVVIRTLEEGKLAREYSSSGPPLS